jgi:hypothetical protein
MTYTIIIPSYKRHDILVTHTLKALERTDVRRPVVVYTADKEETARYREVVPRWVDVVTGVRGLPNQHNHIQQQFAEGEHLLFMDDDLKDIIGLDSNARRVKATRLHDFVETAFMLVDMHGMRMFGINSTNSNLEMKNTVSVGRVYIVGNFYGFINSHSELVDTGKMIPLRKEYRAGKESHERSLQQWDLHGGVFKFRSFGVVSKYWGVPGGLQVSRTAEGEEQAARILHAKYPDSTTLRFYKNVWDLTIKPKTQVLRMAFPQPAPNLLA